ncbi:MAG: peptidase M48 [Gordonia sp.]|nr:peptidase M48 [Gordonia sp. (in: high G+C Gram-positive bacteria)]
MDAQSPIPNVPGVADPSAGQINRSGGDQRPIQAGETPRDGFWLPPAHYAGRPRLHPWEIPMLIAVITVTLVGYLAIVWLVVLGTFSDYFLFLLALPLVLLLIRGLTYAQPRVNGVQMTPTQFADGHRMVVEAAARYGLEYVPDAYVVLGNGMINAFASGHGFRRFVVVYSDLFEVGGRARDPQALEFIIGHEVGHIAAGHTSYWRQLATSVGMNIPLVGSALSRAQEYTADNYGYYTRPAGAPGVIGVLSAGKYMLSAVDFDQFADRATQERGFFTWATNALATHPVLTWRAAALRDRTRAGAMLFRPRTIVRGVGSGNVVAVVPPPHPAAVAAGSLPNGLQMPPKL